MPELTEPIQTDRSISYSLMIDVLDPIQGETEASSGEGGVSEPYQYTPDATTSETNASRASADPKDACMRVGSLEEGCLHCGSQQYRRVSMEQIDHSEHADTETESDQLTLDDIIPDSLQQNDIAKDDLLKRPQGDGMVLLLKWEQCETVLYKHPLLDSL